jgi:hypothetical protein
MAVERERQTRNYLTAIRLVFQMLIRRPTSRERQVYLARLGLSAMRKLTEILLGTGTKRNTHDGTA